MEALSYAPRLTEAQARKARAETRRSLAKHLRTKDRATLADLGAGVKTEKQKKREALSEVVAKCRAARAAHAERAKRLRAEARATLNAAIEAERQANREACRLEKEAARAKGDLAVQEAIKRKAAEARFQAQGRRIDRWKAERSRPRSTAAERRQEADEAVEVNIPGETIPLWRKVRRLIRGNDRTSRTEVFLKYVEENPHEVIEAQEELDRAWLKKLQREARERPPEPETPPSAPEPDAVALGFEKPRRRGARAAEVDLSDVPF